MHSACVALVGILLGTACWSARAQSTALRLELTLDETLFLPGEELPLGVRISNLTGRPVTFGTTTNWLTFLVETKGGEIVNRFGPVPVQGEFTLESSKAGTKWWNLQPWFDFQQPGPYLVFAELRLPDWNQRLLSDPIGFTLQSSTKLWEMSFGVPPAPGELSSAPEIRRYALQSATRSKERKLYARVSDDSGTRIYKVVLLDRLLSFSNPQQQIDGLSRLHVLFQTGGSTYTYSVLDPEGTLLIRQRHEIVNGIRPRMLKNADGTIAVGGGRRLPALSDVPPYEAPPREPTTNTGPAATNTPPPADTAQGESK